MLSYQVFHNKNGLNHVEICLAKLGMQPELIQQISKVLGVTSDLVAGARATKVLGDVGIASFPEDLVSDSGLVQLLYAYTIQWIGKNLNMSPITIFLHLFISILGEFKLPWSWKSWMQFNFHRSRTRSLLY